MRIRNEIVEKKHEHIAMSVPVRDTKQPCIPFLFSILFFLLRHDSRKMTDEIERNR